MGPGSRRDIALELADRDWIERALGRLPIEQRAVLVAHCYLGFPISEVAEILGIPEGTAKSRLNRGPTAIRAYLSREPDLPARVRVTAP